MLSRIFYFYDRLRSSNSNHLSSNLTSKMDQNAALTTSGSLLRHSFTDSACVNEPYSKSYDFIEQTPSLTKRQLERDDNYLDNNCTRAALVTTSSQMNVSSDSVLFPQKLHILLRDEKSCGNECIISWQYHGRAFKVNNKKRFVEEVLPKYFGHSTYTSFQRQLNMYCFHRIRSGPDKGAYHHELFLRDRPEYCQDITRQCPPKRQKRQNCADHLSSLKRQFQMASQLSDSPQPHLLSKSSILCNHFPLWCSDEYLSISELNFFPVALVHLSLRLLAVALKIIFLPAR